MKHIPIPVGIAPRGENETAPHVAEWISNNYTLSTLNSLSVTAGGSALSEFAASPGEMRAFILKSAAVCQERCRSGLKVELSFAFLVKNALGAGAAATHVHPIGRHGYDRARAKIFGRG